MGGIYKSIPKVAILLATQAKVSRDLRNGILRYVQQRGPWILHFIEGRIDEQRLSDLSAWGCTGIIGRLQTPELVRLIVGSRVPLVIYYMSPNSVPIESYSKRHARICNDNCSIGRLAAEHLSGLGYPHYAFVSDPANLVWSKERCAAFAETVGARGATCHIYPTVARTEERDAGVERAHLADWLKSLPKPVALMAAMDIRGRQVLDACTQAGLSVPREVAVLSVDNDEVLCDTAQPTLSSIQLNAEEAGYRAAETLDQYMRGTLRRRTLITLGPSHVAQRLSSAVLPHADPLVARALAFIAMNISVPFGVPDVVSHLKVSRRSLETRFRAVLGSTVLEEILRQRLERVRLLLKETDLPVCQVTRACGFANPSCLGRLFLSRFGHTMTDFRSAARRQPASLPAPCGDTRRAGRTAQTRT